MKFLFFLKNYIDFNKFYTIYILLALKGGECFFFVRLNYLERERYNMTFKPLHDRVVVRRVENDEKTSGGLIIPDSAQEKPAEGEVVSVGNGAIDEKGNRMPMDVKAGDRILFGKWSGTEVKINGEDMLIMKESDILGIMS